MAPQIVYVERRWPAWMSMRTVKQYLDYRGNSVLEGQYGLAAEMRAAGVHCRHPRGRNSNQRRDPRWSRVDIDRFLDDSPEYQAEKLEATA